MGGGWAVHTLILNNLYITCLLSRVGFLSHCGVKLNIELTFYGDVPYTVNKNIFCP